jgi:UPF0176 protein
VSELQSWPAFGGGGGGSECTWEIKWSVSAAEDAPPFNRMRVTAKASLLPALGDLPIDMRQRGRYVDAGQDWDAIVRDDSWTVVDVRNKYEVALGSFESAINPKMDTFRDFAAFVETQLVESSGSGAKPGDAKVAMFCTGGIRCELASAYLRTRGFNDVVHLRGGILKYLEQLEPGDAAVTAGDDDDDRSHLAGAASALNRSSPAAQTPPGGARTAGRPSAHTTYQGECYVFDKRVALGPGLSPGSYSQCFGCRHPLSAADRADPRYVEGGSCPHCTPAPEQLEASLERHRQIALSTQRGERHLGNNLKVCGHVIQGKATQP